MSRFTSLPEAAQAFGYRTSAAMRKAFERGHLPGDCLLRVGSKTLRVDEGKLAEWLRARTAYPTQPKDRA